MQTEFKPRLIANDSAYLGDVATSQENDDKAPMTCGFYRQEKGTPLIYEYNYHEMKIIIDGHFYISDETGKDVKATKGDVFYFLAGSKVTFRTDDFGLAWPSTLGKERGMLLEQASARLWSKNELRLIWSNINTAVV